jgi:hypothetical protein
MCFGQQNRGGQLVNRHFGQTPLAVFVLGDPGSSKFPWESVRYSSVVVLLYMNHLLKSRFIAVEKKSAAKLQGVPSFSASSSSSSSPKQTLATTPEASSTDARGQSDPLWQTWSTP